MIVVEVVSPSSRGIDRSAKLAGYFSLPSVRHYLIVDTDKRTVLHHRRDDEGRIEVRILPDGPLSLDPPGLELAIPESSPASDPGAARDRGKGWHVPARLGKVRR